MLPDLFEFLVLFTKFAIGSIEDAIAAHVKCDFLSPAAI